MAENKVDEGSQYAADAAATRREACRNNNIFCKERCCEDFRAKVPMPAWMSDAESDAEKCKEVLRTACVHRGNFVGMGRTTRYHTLSVLCEALMRTGHLADYKEALPLYEMRAELCMGDELGTECLKMASNCKSKIAILQEQEQDKKRY